MSCILYLKTNKYRLIHATLAPGNQKCIFLLLKPTQMKFKQQRKIPQFKFESNTKER